MTNIALIVAAAENNVIGHQGQLPWHIPADLKHFRKLTTGHPVIMGRKTWDDIYARLGKPLKDRTNIVLTRNERDKFPDGVLPVASMDASMDEAQAVIKDQDSKDQDVMVIGGAEIYKLFLPLADRIHLTRVFQKPEGDVFFPALDMSAWQEEAREDFDDYAFITLTKRR